MKFQAETCTFCPGGDVTVEDWPRLGPRVSGEALFASDGYVQGFVRQARDYGDMELVGLTSPGEVFGGSSRAWSTEDTFNHFLDAMLVELRAQLPVDGVYLALHGAMAEMNRLGIMVDASHISHDAAMDAMRVSRAPVIASHSSSRALADVPRNMSDEALLALKQNGGGHADRGARGGRGSSAPSSMPPGRPS